MVLGRGWLPLFSGELYHFPQQGPCPAPSLQAASCPWGLWDRTALTLHTALHLLLAQCRGLTASSPS